MSQSSKRSGMVIFLLVLVLAVLAVTVTSCGKSKVSSAKLKGEVKLDGSSTVFPISEAVAEEFQNKNPQVRVTVGLSGTGGGFKKFSTGEIDISDASRPIEAEEINLAKENGVEYIELVVANDGLSVVVNPANKFVKSLTVAQLKRIWEPGSKVTTWKDVDPSWPDQKIQLFGPGTDSGTFDFFTEKINGKEAASRADYTASEDDNILVQGIVGDKNSLGYLGYAYYFENKSKMKLVAVDDGDGPVKPSAKTVRNGTYKPLSRPLYIYVSKKSLKRPEVKAFIKFYLEHGAELAASVGYVPLKASLYKEQLSKVK